MVNFREKDDSIDFRKKINVLCSHKVLLCNNYLNKLFKIFRLEHKLERIMVVKLK